jgi:hypothetical protein
LTPAGGDENACAQEARRRGSSHSPAGVCPGSRSLFRACAVIRCLRCSYRQTQHVDALGPAQHLPCPGCSSWMPLKAPIAPAGTRIAPAPLAQNAAVVVAMETKTADRLVRALLPATSPSRLTTVEPTSHTQHAVARSLCLHLCGTQSWQATHAASLQSASSCVFDFAEVLYDAQHSTV